MSCRRSEVSSSTLELIAEASPRGTLEERIEVMIKAKQGLADQFKGDKRPVTLVGINFRAAKRNIDEPLFAKL